jgi:ribokinase
MTTGGSEPPHQGPRRRVVVVGSSNQDIVLTVPRLPSPGQTVIGDSITLLPGGKGANQAVAAARAGAHVVFVSAVGNDDGGRQAIDSLRDEGIDSSTVTVYDDQPTGTAVVLVSGDGENEIAIVQGANAALSGADVREALRRLDIGPGDVCLISFEIEDEAVTEAAACAAERGAQLLVNPAPARALNDHILAARPLLLPNSSEAEALSGRTGDEAAHRLHQMTSAPVIVTRGSSGVLIIDGTEERHVPALPVEAVDTTGAGDTFAGVLAARLADGDRLDDAVSYAVVAAALSVTKAGAREGSPTAAQVAAQLSALRSPAAGG